jgi:LPPG:FO 2-phospho-L-lactate transferase
LLGAIAQAEAVIVCPSNPITSIGPILAVPEIRGALEKTAAPVLAVSPIIGKVAVSGPAHKLMSARGFEASPLGVAKSYNSYLDMLVIAQEDHAISRGIDALGVKAFCADIRMNSLADKKRLAAQVLALVGK